MIINSVSFNFLLPLVLLPCGILLCVCFCLQVIKKNREEKKERKKKYSGLGYHHLDSFLYFVFISFYFWFLVVTFYLCYSTCNILLFSEFCKDNVYCVANQ
jgi:hypothetical protein